MARAGRVDAALQEGEAWVEQSVRVDQALGDGEGYQEKSRVDLIFCFSCLPVYIYTGSFPGSFLRSFASCSRICSCPFALRTRNKNKENVHSH